MGKSKIEGLIMREVEDLVEDFKGLTKEPSKLPFSINIAVLNIIWQLVASHRYDFDDKVVEDFMKRMNDFQDKFLLLIMPDFFPILEYIMPESLFNYLVGKKELCDYCKEFGTHIQHFIDEHLKTLNPNCPRDLIDEYLIELKEKKSDEFSHFSTSDLIRTTFDLFFAGNDTTSNMTRWILTYMAKFPEIQEKIQSEIDRVVPRDTLPGLQHRNELAYLDAMINEVQRHASMISLGVFRCATKDLKLEGFDIPKGTVVLSMGGLSHRDPTYFKDPDKFDPSRFLDENGKFISTCDGFQAFGMGKRQCLGEQFARMEFYSITSSELYLWASRRRRYKS
ncbi:cytochrome P450 2L1 [Armadillidium vulgare]|nr:cytochrome P450 2L1 [Armadillidium vulgare]